MGVMHSVHVESYLECAGRAAITLVTTAAVPDCESARQEV